MLWCEITDVKFVFLIDRDKDPPSQIERSLVLHAASSFTWSKRVNYHVDESRMEKWMKMENNQYMIIFLAFLCISRSGLSCRDSTEFCCFHGSAVWCTGLIVIFVFLFSICCRLWRKLRRTWRQWKLCCQEMEKLNQLQIKFFNSRLKYVMKMLFLFCFTSYQFWDGK